VPKIKIIIVGALGRMGREIASIAVEDPDITIAGCTEAIAHPGAGGDYGSQAGLRIKDITVSTDLSSLPLGESVCINFSSPEAIDGFIDVLGKRRTRLVLGTTGLSAAAQQRVRALAERIPVVFSPNMSQGVNLLFHLTKLVASKLKDAFDIEIIEAHHRYKKDAPSGTARRLGEIIAAELGTSYDAAVKNGRAGMPGERTGNEIGMHAIRGGDIVGDHTVLFAGIGERVELRHMAHSRRTFAAGALAAARWLWRRTPGLYSMHDVLGL